MKRPFLTGFIVSFLLVAAANITDACLALLIRPREPDFGLPFHNYEYVEILNRGKILWSGISSNISFAIVLGVLIGVLIIVYQRNRGKAARI